MKTLLDIERENAVIRKEREDNLKELNARLADAKMTATFIPDTNNLENNNARRVVAREIQHIQHLIADEQKAINLLVDATPEQVSQVMSRI